MTTEKQGTARTKTGQFPPKTSGNPNGRPPGKATSPSDSGGFTVDGWGNFVSGLGDARFDKRLQNRMVCKPVGYDEARNIYQGSDMGARLVEARVKEMWRPGFEIVIKELQAASGDDDVVKPTALKMTKTMRSPGRALTADAATQDMKTIAKRAERKFRKLKGKRRFREAQHYANAYGAGAVMMIVKDRADSWAEPMDPNVVQSIQSLVSFEAEEFTPIAWYEELGDKFGEPMMYQVTPRSQSGTSVPVTYVHESRMIVFRGVHIGRMQRNAQSWLGDSCFTRVKQILSDFDLGFASVGILLQEISIACMKVKGLAQAAANDEGRKKLFARLAAVAMAKSIANMTLIDADGEEFSRTNAPVTGVADLLQVLMQRVAAAFDMPVTVLMGMSPAGMNATGASDIRQWYDDIATERSDTLDEPMTMLMGMILRTLNGGIEPADWCIEWGPLYQMDPKQEAEIFAIYATADGANVVNGFYTADEVRKSRYSGTKFGTDIVIDSDEGEDHFEPEEIEEYAAAKKVGETPAPVETKPDPAASAAPIAPGAAPAGAEIQKTAMNGAQFQAMLQITQAVNEKTIARESGLAMLMVGMQISESEAASILGPVTFESEKPTPPPSPFGGGKPPIPPAPAPGGKDPKTEEKVEPAKEEIK